MKRDVSLAFVFSVAIAFLLILVPFPDALAAWKPYWLAMVLLYWIIEDEQRVTLGLLFFLGLAADVLVGNLLGEQALRLIVLGFIALRYRSRLRFFTMWQQTLAILLLLFNDRILLLMVRAFAGRGWPAWDYWLSPLAGALLWPFVFLLLDGLRSHARLRD